MDNELLHARINDLATLCDKTNAPKFLGFLNPTQAALAQKQLGNNVKHSFYGGYNTAERTILCFMPNWCEAPVFPITALTISYRKCDKLAHRDFLGALMALGITREKVGDILVEDGRTVVFVCSDLADFICSQVFKIGSVGVTITQGFNEPLPTCGKREECSTTLASMRLDSVVAAICNVSRSDAATRICDGLVFINSIACEKSTRIISAGDVVTVRQKGRFEILSCDEFSKKGRIILKYSKYI